MISATLRAGFPASPSHSNMLTTLKYSFANSGLKDGNHG